MIKYMMNIILDMIDMEETIEDYVNSTDIEHKKQVIDYLIETYKTITK